MLNLGQQPKEDEACLEGGCRQGHTLVLPNPANNLAEEIVKEMWVSLFHSGYSF